MSRYSREKILTLPQRARDAFFDGDANVRLVEEVLGLIPDGQRGEYVDSLLDVYFSILTPAGFVSKLDTLIPDPDKRKRVAVATSGLFFLPLADYFGADIFALIIAQGGDPNIFRSRVPARDVVAQVRRAAGVAVREEHLAHRLDKIIESGVAGARKDDQLQALLTGPAKTSGLGLQAGDAAKVVEAIKNELQSLEKRGVQVVSDEEYDRGAASSPEGEGTGSDEGEIGEEGAGDAAPAAARPEKPPETFVTVSAEDEKEIAAIQAKTGVALSAAAETAVTLETAVDAAVKESGVPLADEDQRKRFQALVALYFRDLRDGLETKSKLTMPAQSGGMGMDDAGADRVMALLEAKSKGFHEASIDRVGQEKERFVSGEAQKVMTASETAATKEKQALDSRFEKLVVKAGLQAPAVPAPVTPLVSDTAQPKMIPVIAVPSKPVLVPAAADMLAVPPPPAPVPAAPELAARSSPHAVPTAPTAPPPTDLPFAETAPLRIPTPPPAAGSGKAGATSSGLSPAPQKPVVSDVMSAPRLVGPMDELRAMSLKDFRRLSKDPKEATLKVKDKIDLIAERGFELKGQAVKAWQESETNKTYLDLLRRSLEGKPVPDVINEFEAKGLLVLSKAEFDAIMTLNRELRFG